MHCCLPLGCPKGRDVKSVRHPTHHAYIVWRRDARYTRYPSGKKTDMAMYDHTKKAHNTAIVGGRRSVLFLPSQCQETNTVPLLPARRHFRIVVRSTFTRRYCKEHATVHGHKCAFWIDRPPCGNNRQDNRLTCEVHAGKEDEFNRRNREES